jgi:hypothetical protein
MQLLVFCLGLRYATWILSFGHMTKTIGLRLRCTTWDLGFWSVHTCFQFKVKVFDFEFWGLGVQLGF